MELILPRQDLEQNICHFFVSHAGRGPAGKFTSIRNIDIKNIYFEGLKFIFSFFPNALHFTNNIQHITYSFVKQFF